MGLLYDPSMPRNPLSLLLVLFVAACSGSSEPVSQWQQVFGPDDGIDSALLGVWGSAADDVYVVGGGLGNGNPGFVSRYNGTVWNDIDVDTNATLWWAWGPGPETVFFTGEAGTILKRQGGTNTVMTTPRSDVTIFGLWGSDADDVWAVGGDPFADLGVIWRKEGDAWIDATPDGYQDSAIYKVWGSSASDVWFVGLRGLLLHYDGSSWSEHRCGTTTLFTIAGQGSDNVWAVGGPPAVICHYDGSEWQQVTLPDGFLSSINSGVDVDALGQPWVVGSNASKFRIDETQEWVDNTFDGPVIHDLHAVWVDDDGAAFMVGGNLNAPRGSERVGIVGHYGPKTVSSIRQD